MPAAKVDYSAATSLADEIDGAAFQAALDAIASLSHPPEHPPHLDSRGNLLLVPFGDYQLDKTLHITRPIVLQGVSGANGCTLRFAEGIDGIVVDHANTSQDGGGGGWCVIRDVMLASTNEFGIGHSVVPALNEDDPLTADPETHSGHPLVSGSGIVLFDRAIIENCTIVGFQYDGIHIEAIDANKNANTWAMRTCRLFTNGRHGFYSAGENANAGLAVGISSTGNSGWAFYDRSFLGNTFVGCQAEVNGHPALDVRCLLAHSSGLYAGTADGGVHRSPDSGARWSAVNTGLTVTHDTPGAHPGDPTIPHPALLPTIHALAVANVAGHQAPQVLYAGTDPGWQFDTRDPKQGGIPGRQLTGAAVFSSDDLRHTWAMVGHDNAGLTGADVHALAIAPLTDRQTPATVYAGTTNGVFKTTDGGTSWTGTDTVGLTSPDVRALAIDPTAPATVYAGTTNGVFKTTDGGTSWTGTDTVGLTPKDRPAGLDVRALAIDPPTAQTPAVVYAGTSGGVFKTTDGGTTWQDTAATYYGGAYKTTSTLADNVFLGSYSESGEGSGSEFAWPTLVLGGKLGGGFGPSTDGSLITNVSGSNGVVGLPLRSQIYHQVRKVIGDPIKGAVFGAYEPTDDVILADASAGAVVVDLPPVLPPATDITGHELTIKKIDNTTNRVLIQATNAAPVDGIVQDIILDVPLSAVTVVALRDGWQTIGRLSP